MQRKRGQDEEIFMFALKIVGPIAFFFVVAIFVDLSHMIDWAGSDTPDPIRPILFALVHPDF